MKLTRILLKYLPENMRHQLLRKMITAPDPSDHGVIYKIASTQHELEAAFSLLHNCYVATGFISPEPHGLRCNLYSILPYTTIIIAKKGDEIIGTVSLIKDSSLGFPSDKNYKNENDFYRSKQAQMVEISALAVHPRFRKTKDSNQISLYLMKYLYHYTFNFMGCDTLCATVHPRTYDFYRGLLGFEKNGEIMSYEFVRGALAMHITLDMPSFRSKWIPENYPANKANFGCFLNSDSPEFMRYPKRKSELLLDPVFTKEMLRYFAVTKTSLAEQLSIDELSLVQEAYQAYFDSDFMSTASTQLFQKRQRTFRNPAQISAALSSKNQLLIGTITDISEAGAFFKTNEVLALGATYRIIMHLNNELIKVNASICWLNDKNTFQKGNGYGLCFENANQRIEQHIRSSHLNYKHAA